MIDKVTDAMVAIEGEAMRPVTWVRIEEVKSGDWAIAFTAAVVSALPPIAHAPLSISWMRTQVTGRMASPSIATMASVTLWIMAFFAPA